MIAQCPDRDRPYIRIDQQTPTPQDRDNSPRKPEALHQHWIDIKIKGLSDIASDCITSSEMAM